MQLSPGTSPSRARIPERPPGTRLLANTLSAFVIGLLTACTPDRSVPPTPTEPPPRTFLVMACKPGQSTALPMKVPDSATAMTSLLKIEAYPTELRVDPGRTRNNELVFRRITDALAEARQIRSTVREPGCPITIRVNPGVYVGTTTPGDTTKEALPLRIDVPDIHVQGSTRTIADSIGMPLADPTSAIERTDLPRTILTASPALRVIGPNTQTGVSEPLIVVDTTDEGGGNGAIIAGFVFRSGHAQADTVLGGKGILVMRARDVNIFGNQFEGNFTERIDLRGGSAIVTQNYLSGPGDTCDICVAGPGTFTVAKNRLVQGGIPGVLIVPAAQLPVPEGVTQSPLPANATVKVDVTQNIIAGHQRVPVGVGIRVATVGINASSVIGLTNARIAGNVLSHNRFGIIVEAGFPTAGSPLRGDAIVDIANNSFAQNCQADLYLSFARHTTGLGLSKAPYLHGSSYRVKLDTAGTLWYANPAGYDNVLVINEHTMANGIQQGYSPTRVCP